MLGQTEAEVPEACRVGVDPPAAYAVAVWLPTFGGARCGECASQTLFTSQRYLRNGLSGCEWTVCGCVVTCVTHAVG